MEEGSSPPPLFIGSSSGGGGLRGGEMEVGNDVLPSQEEEEEVVDSGVVEEDVELDLPELSREEVVVGAVKGLMEIPDSDAESEFSSPVKGVSGFGGERVDGGARVVGWEEDVLIEGGSVVGQGGIEELNGGNFGERMNGTDGNAVSLEGVNGDVRIGDLDDLSQYEDERTVPIETSQPKSIMDGEDDHIVQPITKYEPQNVVAYDQMGFDASSNMEDQAGSLEGPKHLHMVIPRSEQNLPTTALQKAQMDALGALHDVEDGVKGSTSNRGLESMDLDLKSTGPGEDTETTNPSHEVGNLTSQPRTIEEPYLSEQKEAGKATIEKPVEDNPEHISCTSTTDKQTSTEMDGVQATECVLADDEVSLIPTGDSSQHKVTVTADSVTRAEPEKADMEDVIHRETHAMVEAPVIKESVPRATRRISSRKSDATSAVTSKQGRRVSGRGKSQLDSEITEPQPPTESSAMDLDNSIERAKESERTASSKRKKSQRGAQVEEVLLPGEDTETTQDNAEQFPENFAAPAPVVESQNKKEPPAKLATRRKSQRGTKTDEIVSIRADSPESMRRNNEVDKQDPVMTPAPEPEAEVPTRKKSQRKASSTSRKASGTSTKRQLEEEPEEQHETVADINSTSLSVPETPVATSSEPQKPDLSRRPVLPAREGSQSKDVLIAELKAMKIVRHFTLIPR